MAPQALCGARVFTGEHFVEDHAVLLDGDRILDVLPAASVPAEFCRHDLGGGVLAPGFLDAQVNGGGGVLFNEQRTAQGATAIALAHARHGSTGLLPTFITDSADRQLEAMAAIREAIAAKAPGILGIHLEGPFLATARKGAHDPSLIRALTDGDVDALLDSGIDTVLLTVAAENASPQQIRRLTDGGIIVSLGHSAASYEMAAAAADAGARGVTHLYNAMSPLEHRAPGLVGAALDHGGLWAGLIADGHHAHPAALRIALRAKQGPARLFLVSDAMPLAASPGTTFALNGRTVTRRDGRLTLEDGTLAGSLLTMDQAVKYAVDHLHQPLAEALRMASLYPAQFLRLDRDRGRIAPGFVADMVLLADDLSVRSVWIAGVSGQDALADQLQGP
jgi:N-acetylglucosamine-6-phosphate deacetylase